MHFYNKAAYEWGLWLLPMPMVYLYIICTFFSAELPITEMYIGEVHMGRGALERKATGKWKNLHSSPKCIFCTRVDPSSISLWHNHYEKCKLSTVKLSLFTFCNWKYNVLWIVCKLLTKMKKRYLSGIEYWHICLVGLWPQMQRIK